MRVRAAGPALCLAALGLLVAGTPSALGASRTITIDGWANRAVVFSGSRLVWTEAATVHVDPKKITGSPAGAAPFDYYRAEAFRVALTRGSRLFRAGAPENPVSVRTSVAAMGAGILAPTGGGGFVMVPRTSGVAPPVIHCCDDAGDETVLESDGRADAPVTIAATWDAGSVAWVQIGPGGLQQVRRASPLAPSAVTTVATTAPAVAGRVAISPSGLAWVDPAAPDTLQVRASGAATATPVALPGPALRVWSATNVIVVAVRRGSRVALVRIDQPALRATRIWTGAVVPRVALGGGSVAVAERRRVLAARRGSLKVLARTRRVAEAVGIDGRRVAWIDRHVRRRARVAVVHLGVAR